MRIFKKIIRISLFFLINILLFTTCQFFFEEPTPVKYILNEFNHMPEVDTIILGESHAAQGYDPFILSQETNSEVFNLSRPGMPINNFYYLLRLANKQNGIRRVIFDIDDTFWMEGIEENIGLEKNLLQYLDGGLAFDYMYHISRHTMVSRLISNYTISLGTVRRCPDNIRIKKEMDQNVSPQTYFSNITTLEINQGGVGNKSQYRGRGFFYNEYQVNSVDWGGRMFNPLEIRYINLYTFERIVRYCSENEIELICVQSALPPQIVRERNVEEVHTYFKALCDNHEVEFYDMNYVKSEYMHPSASDFCDNEGHMTGEMASVQSHILSKIIMSDDSSQFFYKTYDEVAQNLNLVF